MFEFVQAYGGLIVFGLLFLLMMRMHGRHGGMGCGMGSHNHQAGNHDHATAEEPGTQVSSRKLDKDAGCH